MIDWNRELLKQQCEAVCERFKHIPESGPYGEHRLVLDLLEQTEWIPVSERLPEESGYYLVSVAIEDCFSLEVFEKVFVRWFAHPDDYFITEGEWREGINNKFINESITAWMPLPEPYSESEVKE